MKQRLKAIEEDVWTAVESGWTEPCVKTKDGEYAPKPKEQWTETDKLESKFNSKAIYEIFNAINAEQFKLVQGCSSAKDAWETRIDHLVAIMRGLQLSKEQDLII